MTDRRFEEARRRLPRRITPEGAVLKAVTDLLTAERIWWMRCNTGTQVLADGNGKKRVFRAGRKGMADILALPVFPARCRKCGCGHSCQCDGGNIYDGLLTGLRPTWIECKAQAGRQSPAQKAFQAEVEAAGHAYLLVRDVQQVIEFLERRK